jgi:hypothetical protein
MDFTNPAVQAAFTKATGFHVLLRHADYMPLRVDSRALVNEKLRRLPWIPASALDAIMAVPATQPMGSDGVDYTLIPVPLATVNQWGVPLTTRPAWLDTNEKRMIWDELAIRYKKAEMAFNQKRIDKGRAEMQAAYADVAFWDRALKIARILALPVTVAEKAAEGFLKSNVFKIALLIAVGFGMWKYSKRKGKA